MGSFDKLNNQQVAQLADLLLNDQRRGEVNVIKKLEREQLQMKVASGVIGSSQMLGQYGLASTSPANIGQSGLNLSKMTEDIQ